MEYFNEIKCFGLVKDFSFNIIKHESKVNSWRFHMNPLHLQCTCINFNIYQFHYSVCTKISLQDEVIKKIC